MTTRLNGLGVLVALQHSSYLNCLHGFNKAETGNVAGMCSEYLHNNSSTFTAHSCYVQLWKSGSFPSPPPPPPPKNSEQSLHYSN